MSDPFAEIIREQALLDKTLERARLKETPISEKGTYVPTYVGGTTPGTTTYSFQSGVYAVIGPIIVVTGQINWTAATGTGEARISVPFTPTGGNYGGTLRISAVTFANSTPELLISSGNLYFNMDSPITNAGTTRVQMEAAGSVIWTIVYRIR